MCDKQSEILKSLAPAAWRWKVLHVLANQLRINQSERAKSTIHFFDIMFWLMLIDLNFFQISPHQIFFLGDAS